MRKASRCRSVLGSIALVLVGLAACGGSGSGSSDPIVVHVAGVASISEATLKHWMSVNAAVFYQEVPTGPVPKGVLPDPPSYKNCIAYLGSLKHTLIENGPKPTTAQLETECIQDLRKIKELTLDMLIQWDWTLGTGKAAGIKATEAEISRRYDEVNAKLFPRKGEFAAYLERTGQTHADMLYRAKVQLFEVTQAAAIAAAEKRISPKLTEQQQQAALFKLVPGLRPTTQWIAETSCSKGFVTLDCKQYKGSATAG